MNRLRIRWNDGKRSVCSAALAAVLVLLAGGANALANTVWTVSKSSSVATCSPSATTCNTIGAAVSAASAGDVIVVGQGHYIESVDIQTPNLTILGAQAGRDARVDRYNPAKESIVDATGQGSGLGNGAAFYIDASNVVIDGFTIQGGTAGTAAAGIWVDELNIQVLNNIIQNNAVGIYSEYAGPLLIEYNAFTTNNAGTAGSADDAITGLKGFGIAGETVDGTTITENAFTGNLAAAMYFYLASGGAVTQNTSEKDGSFVVFNASAVTIFSDNQGQDFGGKGLLPVHSTSNADAAIDVIASTSPTPTPNSQLQINNNVLEGGKVPGYSGIAFSANVVAPLADVCDYCQVSGNTIGRFAGSGIVAEPTVASVATLGYSIVSHNYVEDNDIDGILIGLAPGNEFNSLLDNQAQGNHVFDCADDTSGSVLTLIGTLATADTWTNNTGSLVYPRGLCKPPSVAHD